MAGNLMKYYEQQILDLTEEARNELALQCIKTIISDGNGGFRFEDNAIVGVVLFGAKVGIGEDRPLNRHERRLAKYVAETVFTSLTEKTISDMIDAMQIKEDIYDHVRMFANLGWEIAMAYFRYILCWALADGVIEAELEERLESIFGLFLILEFGNSGLESVPAPKVQLTELEAEIARQLKADKDLTFLRDIQARVPNRSGSEVKRALDSLCKKGVLSYVDTIVGNMYSLENENWTVVPERRPDTAKEADPSPARPSFGYRPASRVFDDAKADIKNAIIAQMEPGRLYTLTDMIMEIPACREVPRVKVSSLARQLCDCGRLERVEERGKACFRLP